MLKIVIDSNIWISALLVPQGKSRELLTHFLSGSFLVTYPPRLIDEIRRTASKPRLSKRINPEELSSMISLIEEQAILVDPAHVAAISRDPMDDVFLACALDSQSDFLVTGDDDLLILGTYHATQIVTVSDFLEVLFRTKN